MSVFAVAPNPSERVDDLVFEGPYCNFGIVGIMLVHAINDRKR